MSNVLNEEKQQQVIALGRVGRSLWRIEQRTGVRCETVSAYLRQEKTPDLFFFARLVHASSENDLHQCAGAAAVSQERDKQEQREWAHFHDLYFGLKLHQIIGDYDRSGKIFSDLVGPGCVIVQTGARG